MDSWQGIIPIFSPLRRVIVGIWFVLIYFTIMFWNLEQQDIKQTGPLYQVSSLPTHRVNNRTSSEPESAHAFDLHKVNNRTSSEPESAKKRIGLLDSYERSFVNLTSENSQRFCMPFQLNFDHSAKFFDCNWNTAPSSKCDYRLRASITCGSSPDIVYEWVNSDAPSARYEYDDHCLDAVIKNKCYDGNAIPKVVHFVYFGRNEFPFYGMWSVISAFRFVQVNVPCQSYHNPCLLVFHCDYHPSGRYWDILVRQIPNILLVNRSAPDSVFGHVVKVIEHSADVARLEAIRRFGGIYMDIDHILINPIDNLRNYSVVMSIETEGVAIGNGMFLAQPGAKFLNLWYDSYQSFNDEDWGGHSVIMPYILNKVYSQSGLRLVDSFFKPTDRMLIYEMYTKHFDWTHLYGMHLYARSSKLYLKERLESRDSSMGEIVRRILYGDSKACFVKEWCFGRCSYDMFIDLLVYVGVTMCVALCVVYVNRCEVIQPV